MIRRLIILLLIVGCEDEYGCTDANASNFDADATIFDNSCDYNIYGCTDANATNYNVDVTVDDNSCEYISFSDYSDYETIYSTIDSGVLGGEATGVTGNGIWGACNSIGIHSNPPSNMSLQLTPPTPYPNPFDDLVNIWIAFQLNSYGDIYILNQSYDIIKTIFSGDIGVGTHSFVWDGKNDEGMQVEDGYYRIIHEYDNYQCFANLHLN